MALIVFKNASVTINAVDLSDHVKSVEIKYSAESLENTAMGATFKGKQAGLKDWSMSVEFYQDYAAAQVDATLFSLVGAAPFAIIVRPDAAVKGTANPEFTGNVLLPDYTPITGSVGELATVKVDFEGTGALGRATS